MKRWVTTAAALLCLALLAAAGGCSRIARIDQDGTNPPETDAPETDVPGTNAPDFTGLLSPETDVPETEPTAPDPGPRKPDFTMDELYEKNGIRDLLAAHDCVTVTQSPGSDGESVNSFWMKDGELAYYYVNTITYAGWDGEPMTGVYQGGTYRGVVFEVHPEQPVTANLWLDPFSEESGFSDGNPGDFLRSYLPGYVVGEPEVVNEDGALVTVLVHESATDQSGGEIALVNRITVERETLAVRAMEWEYEMDGETWADSLVVDYDGERLGTDVLEDWEGTRTVGFEMITETGAEDRVLTLPGLWRMNIWTWQDWMVSDEYAVPGIDSYVVEPGSGSVTLYVRDEANLPADTPEGAGWDALGFTRDALIEANRITNLTVKYGTVTVSETAEYGESAVSFFRYGEPIVMYAQSTVLFEGAEEAGWPYGSVATGDMNFTVMPQGVLASAVPDGGNADPGILITGTNAEGEFYTNDLYIAGSILEGDVTDVSRENGTVTFRVESWYVMGDRNLTYFYTVDEETLQLLSWGEYLGEWSCAVSVGETIPFEAEFAKAFADTRTVTYHAQLAGEARDYVYIVPSSWSFTLSLYGDQVSFTADAAGLIPVDNLIPADGKSYEIWVSDAVG